jgi:uncharacterized repeat protein (TIGR03843 family)
MSEGSPDVSAVPPAGLTVEAALDLLRRGRLDVQGRLVDASNATLYCEVTVDGLRAACVYKPVAGERPLWDFPDGTLAAREVAAYAVSAATGWDIVPPTVLRDGPYGPGMCQLWIDVDAAEQLVALRPPDRPGTGWLPVLEALDEGGEPVVLAHRDDERLRRMAVFDVVVNNADRKGGHLLPTAAGHVYGVDHGVCFSVEDKLRTLLWGWRGQPLDDGLCEVLRRLEADLDAALGTALADLLTAGEVEAIRVRVRRLLARRMLPRPRGRWPSVPWPPI